MSKIHGCAQRSAWRPRRSRRRTGADAMFGPSLLALAMLSQPAFAGDLPKPISCYQDCANAKDIEAYMSCFAADAEMIDVSRTFAGQDAIRAWALREVISSGETFRHRKILEQGFGYAKTEVNWRAGSFATHTGGMMMERSPECPSSTRIETKS